MPHIKFSFRVIGPLGFGGIFLEYPLFGREQFLSGYKQIIRNAGAPNTLFSLGNVLDTSVDSGQNSPFQYFMLDPTLGGIQSFFFSNSPLELNAYYNIFAQTPFRVKSIQIIVTSSFSGGIIPYQPTEILGVLGYAESDMWGNLKRTDKALIDYLNPNYFSSPNTSPLILDIKCDYLLNAYNTLIFGRAMPAAALAGGDQMPWEITLFGELQ